MFFAIDNLSYSVPDTGQHRDARTCFRDSSWRWEASSWALPVCGAQPLIDRPFALRTRTPRVPIAAPRHTPTASATMSATSKSRQPE